MNENIRKKDKHRKKVGGEHAKLSTSQLLTIQYKQPWYLCFVCYVVLRPKSTAMVIAGRSVHIITLFPGQA